MRVLLVEDDTFLAADLLKSVTAAGYVCDIAADGEQAWFQGDTTDYVAIVLDLGLPRLDGLSVLKKWRLAGNHTPVLILTARDSWREKVEAIDAGADDYLTKPFRVEELLARLRAITRRSSTNGDVVFKAGRFELDTSRRSASLDGVAINLSALEYRLLALLMHRRGHIISSAEIAEQVYGSDREREANAIEALVTRVRRKLGLDLIETRRGLGYVII